MQCCAWPNGNANLKKKYSLVYEQSLNNNSINIREFNDCYCFCKKFKKKKFEKNLIHSIILLRLCAHITTAEKIIFGTAKFSVCSNHEYETKIYEKCTEGRKESK